MKKDTKEWTRPRNYGISNDSIIDSCEDIKNEQDYGTVDDKHLGLIAQNMIRELILETKHDINENYKNLFNVTDKNKYADDVWDILNKSYKKIGGIKGKGFNNKNDMVKNIPFWKIFIRDGKILYVAMYKDNNGRKLVAAGTNGKQEGISVLKKTLEQDFKRSYIEVSGPLLKYIKKVMPTLFNKYKIRVDVVKSLLDKPITKIDDYNYSRDIGGETINKIMVGTPGKNIY